jgi:hypothetical protein
VAEQHHVGAGLVLEELGRPPDARGRDVFPVVGVGDVDLARGIDDGPDAAALVDGEGVLRDDGEVLATVPVVNGHGHRHGVVAELVLLVEGDSSSSTGPEGR